MMKKRFWVSGAAILLASVSGLWAVKGQSPLTNNRSWGSHAFLPIVEMNHGSSGTLGDGDLLKNGDRIRPDFSLPEPGYAAFTIFDLRNAPMVSVPPPGSH